LQWLDHPRSDAAGQQLLGAEAEPLCALPDQAIEKRIMNRDFIALAQGERVES
jgi:hypothetical protein